MARYLKEPGEQYLKEPSRLHVREQVEPYPWQSLKEQQCHYLLESFTGITEDSAGCSLMESMYQNRQYLLPVWKTRLRSFSTSCNRVAIQIDGLA
jgi:hypothetical protein